MLARLHYPPGATASDETSCQLPCQHPSCWASKRRQETGVPHKLPPVVFRRSEETDLPMQSILNLLSEYGQNNSNECSESLGEGCLHQSSSKPLGPKYSSLSSSTGCRQRTSRNRDRHVTGEPTCGQASSTHLHVIEVADSIKKRDFASGWNEPCVGSQLYVWLPNSKNITGNCKSRSLEDKNSLNPHIKDMTESMMPEEVDCKRQSSILFADWPTLKKKHAYNRRQRKLPTRESAVLSLDTRFSGINNSQSHPTLHGQLSPVLSEKSSVSQSTDATEILSTRSSELLHEHEENICRQAQQEKPRANLDGTHFSHDSSLRNRMIRHRARNILPGNYKRKGLTLSSHQTSDRMSKVTSVSLDLPDFLATARRAKPFSYGKQDLDFSLGPVPVSVTKNQKRFDLDCSDQVPGHGFSTSATLLMQQTGSNLHADKLNLGSVSPPVELQVTIHDAAATIPGSRSSPRQELQHLPDSHITPELVADTKPDLQRTTARRHTEAEPATDRKKPSLDDNEEDRATAESPAPPPPSPEPRD